AIAGSLPANQTLYARLWTKIGGVWLYNDSSFTALPQAQSTVTTETVFPNWGTGIRQAFVFQYSDTAGATDLSTASVWFSPTFTSNAARSCLVSYDRAANALSLLSDAGNAWTRATIGSSGTLHNSQCFVTLGTSTTATMSGNILTLSLAMTFTPAFNGTKNIYMSAANAAV